jgi:CheY-like chemotaxis protein
MTAISRNILFVDDEESQRKFMHSLFVKMGYDAEFAESAKEALEIFNNKEISIIITDLRMPEMDGIELCKRIRETNSKTVIYGYSVNPMEIDPDHLEDVGFDGLLCEPVRLEVLGRAIEGAFEKIEKSEG